MKNPALSYEVSFFSVLWMVFPESWKRICPNFYAHDCNWVQSKKFLQQNRRENLIRTHLEIIDLVKRTL